MEKLLGLNNFGMLNFDDQYMLAHTKGNFVGFTQIENSIYELYTFNFFFVEFRYDSETGNLLQVESFIKGERVYKYLDKIQIVLIG